MQVYKAQRVEKDRDKKNRSMEGRQTKIGKKLCQEGLEEHHGQDDRRYKKEKQRAI